MLGVRTFWDATINDMRDSYGQEWTYEQRMKLQHACQSCFFVGIVVTQTANILANKTKRVSLFRHGIKNLHMNAAILATIALACFLVYVPNLNSALGLYPIRALWWLPAIPFAVYLLTYVELKKFICNKLPGTWLDLELNW